MDFNLEFDDFDALRRLINQHSGIWLSDSKQTFLRVRLGERMRAMNIALPREYYHFLKYDPRGNAELQALLDVVTVNQTWFFRESAPVLAWRAQVLPGLLTRNHWVRLWSAGCSTGEEPYTVAMLLLDAHPVVNRSRFDVLGTDLSRRALAMARAATYDPYSLRHTEAYWKTKYFEPAPDGRMAVRPDVRQLLHFERGNLFTGELSVRPNSIDAVLCRNVIIYFDEKSRQRVLMNLYDALKPGGYLMLGHSESLAHVASPFEVTKVDKFIMYRKARE